MALDKGFEKDIEFEYKQEDASLGQRAVVSGAWIFSFKAFQRLLGLIRTVVLARLLAPEDFGLMGIAVLAINTLETFSKTGFEQALIQKKDIKDHLDPAWTIQIIRSLVLFCLLFAGAPLVALFFKNQQATNIIRVLAFIELFTGAKNVGIVYFQKELRFAKRIVLESCGLVANILVSVILAFMLRNVWALVYGSLAGAFVTCVVSYMVHEYKPKFCFKKAEIYDLFGFGKWLFGSSILVFLVTQGDDAFVGRLLGITALGFYHMAYNLSNSPATEIAHVLSQVTFPVYSKIQDNADLLKKAFLEIVQVTMFFSVPLFVGIFILAGDFTRLFLGEKWMPMVLSMRILAFAGLMRSLAAVIGTLFYGVGKPRLDTFWQTVRFIVMFSLIYPFTVRFGIQGASVAVCASIGISTCGFIVSALRVTKIKILSFLGLVVYPLAGGFLLGICVMVMKYFMGEEGVTGFFLLIFAGGAVYFAASYLYNRFTGYKVLDVIGKRIRGLSI